MGYGNSSTKMKNVCMPNIYITFFLRLISTGSSFFVLFQIKSITPFDVNPFEDILLQ